MRRATQIINQIYEIYNTDPESLDPEQTEALNQKLTALQIEYQKFFCSTGIHWLQRKEKESYLSQDADYYVIN